ALAEPALRRPLATVPFRRLRLRRRAPRLDSRCVLACPRAHPRSGRSRRYNRREFPERPFSASVTAFRSRGARPCMSLIDRIRQQFEDSAELGRNAAGLLAAPIEQAVERLTAALAADRKILLCGNGGSAADSQ